MQAALARRVNFEAHTAVCSRRFDAAARGARGVHAKDITQQTAPVASARRIYTLTQRTQHHSAERAAENFLRPCVNKLASWSPQNKYYTLQRDSAKGLRAEVDFLRVGSFAVALMEFQSVGRRL